MTGYRPPAKHAIKDAVEAALGVGAANGRDIHQLAVATKYRETQVYQSGLHLTQREIQRAVQEGQDVERFLCRDRHAKIVRHTYFWATSPEEAHKYAWLRDRPNMTAMWSTAKIKQYTFDRWHLAEDHPVYEAAEIMQDLAFVAESLSSPTASEEVLEVWNELYLPGVRSIAKPVREFREWLETQRKAA